MNLDTLEIPLWNFAYTSPATNGHIKSQASDFIVEEQLSFSPEGTGEHVFLQIQKTGENTEYIARLLARTAGVRQRDIGFAGLKDRHAITTQWFSIWLPGKESPDWSIIETENIKILHITRHTRKLKRGALTGNQFSLLIRNFSGDKQRCEQQLNAIKTQGFPNYFGMQRFGIQGQNINTALALFAGIKKLKPQQRSLYLSAARSYLFNQILSQRVHLNNWNTVIPGDVLMFNDSKSHFKVEKLDNNLIERITTLSLHATACLYGKGDLATDDEALVIEQQIISEYPNLTTGLLKFNTEMDRRALRAVPERFNWQFIDEQQLHLAFFLHSGSYATALLREIISNN